MKKFISISLVILVLAGLLTGCGKSLEADRDTVYIQKKGNVVSAAIADFDKDYYDDEELKNYIDERVAEYQEEHGKGSVSIDEFSVEDGVARLFIKYDSCEEYQNFNEVTLFSGTIPQALAEGYNFEEEFTEIENGEAAGSADRDAIADLDAKVIILSEKVDVKVDGTIQYVSSRYTTMKAKDTVSIQLPEEAEDGEESALVYVIYE
ncbi:hypothetical protein E5329_20845 [Petralouisia muris]|uniref:Uncharacterized protein n=1 Tax=Petralouisia muris TaxID=3032872 RepID=A0AC61RS89_9FIRM|nr:hypothetical protein [Petralouisia muris]TGY91476.1 hypothetical protein E5329_20845 [Petralouisia muris]